MRQRRRFSDEYKAKVAIEAIKEEKTLRRITMEPKELIKTLDLNYFGSGKHTINLEKPINMFHSDSIYIIDIRSRNECKYVSFPFTENIPLHELPNHIHKLPKNKTIALFCSSQKRAFIANTHLLSEGFDAKNITEDINDYANHFKLGYVKKHLK